LAPLLNNVDVELEGNQEWKLGRCCKRVAEVLDLVGMIGFEERDVNALSGGEQQRVALARRLAPARRGHPVGAAEGGHDPAST
jgi:ABC-type Fe3+/spermidine/putrescine transport system ATPase subunit